MGPLEHKLRLRQIGAAAAAGPRARGVEVRTARGAEARRRALAASGGCDRSRFSTKLKRAAENVAFENKHQEHLGSRSTPLSFDSCKRCTKKHTERAANTRGGALESLHQVRCPCHYIFGIHLLYLLWQNKHETKYPNLGLNWTLSYENLPRPNPRTSPSRSTASLTWRESGFKPGLQVNGIESLL